MAGQSDSEAVRQVACEGLWPADRPFPLTPLEVWYGLQGWEGATAAGMMLEQALLLPGKVRAGSGWMKPWHS